MAGTTLRLLTPATTPADTDLFIVRQAGDTVDKSLTNAKIKAYITSASQPLNANLTSLASLTLLADRGIYAISNGTLSQFPQNAAGRSLQAVTAAADTMPYYTSSTVASTTSLTAFGRSIIGGANAAAVQATLGLGTMATQNAGAVAITGGSITNTSVTGLATPTNGSDAATKSYVDAVTAGLSQKNAVRVSSTGALTATYANGTAGVGATLTNSGAQLALIIDVVTLALNDRVLIKDQASALQNGIYIVTNLGSVATNWVLTRSTDFDQSTEISEGAYTIVEEGSANVGTVWIETGAGPFTIGTTSISFTQLVVAPQTKTFTGDVTGTGTSSIALTIGGNKVLNTMIRQSAALSVIGNTSNATANVADIAAATDGNVLRRAGTALAFGAIALASAGAVSGILAGPNGGTNNGFMAFTGPTTATKTFTLPDASSTILTSNAAVTGAQGGTGQNTTAVGDLLQGAASNTWAKLAAVATGNVLISGGVTTASSWGKVGLTTHISGILAEVNGGTNQSSYATGDTIYATAANTLGKLTIGSVGTVYKSTGTIPGWALPAGARKVSTTTISSGTAAISITGLNAGSDYLIVFSGICGSTSGQRLGLRTSTDGGSTFISTTNSYLYAAAQGGSATGTATSSGGFATFLTISGQFGSTTTNGEFGTIYVRNPNDATLQTAFNGNSFGFDGTSSYSNVYNGYRAVAEANNALQLFPIAGTFSGGIIEVWEIRPS